jgi:hypothetical protein
VSLRGFHVSARPLKSHRFLGTNGLNDRVCTESVSHVLDASHAFIAALGHKVGRAELNGELLPRLVTAHDDDALGPQLLGCDHRAQADRAVTDDCDWAKSPSHPSLIALRAGFSAPLTFRQEA